MGLPCLIERMYRRLQQSSQLFTRRSAEMLLLSTSLFSGQLLPICHSIPIAVYAISD